MNSTDAQKLTHDAGLIIGEEGGVNFAVAVNQVKTTEDEALISTVIAGDPAVIIRGLTHAMLADETLRKVFVAAVNQVAVLNFFNRNHCDCDNCRAVREKKRLAAGN